MLATALTLSVEPGELALSRPVLSGEKRVTLTGRLNAADLAYLADSVASDSELDLGEVSIAAYAGEPVAHGITKSADDELPPYILAGLRASRLILPSGLKTIGAGALLGAEITEIKIPAGVGYIGEHSFAACRRLAKVTFAPGSTLARVPSRTFDGCVLLEEIELPASVTTIDTRAFAGCNSLSDIHFPEELQAIGDEAFAASGLTKADTKACSSLRHIGARAWAECSALASASLPSATVLAGDAIFMGCPSLTAITLPERASSLPALTFAGASAMDELTLPADLTYIGESAFEGWESLREVDARALERVPSLGDSVWGGVDRPKVILRVAEPLEQAYLDADQWRDFSITTSAIMELPAEGTPGSDPIRVSASFNDKLLTVSSEAPMAAVSVYALDGTALTVRPAGDTRDVQVNTARLSGSVFVVSATPASGSDRPIIFKLLRR